jgi:DNA segregation ATPase FtsK/SpoIIIE, S-DNA-T family
MPARPLIDDAHSPEDPAPAFAIRIPVRSVGFVLLAAVGIVMVSLATWSVDDPSLSYATSEPARNWLGFPGAVIADLSFQIFGLGMLAVIVPPALWGWRLMRMNVPSHMGLRILAWIGASLLACGVVAFVAAPESWPLPTGLGGLIGAGFANLAALATGDDPQPVTAVLFGIIIATPALAMFWIAMGLGWIALPALPEVSAKGKRGRAADEEAEDGDEIAPERGGLFDVIIGGLVHLGYSAASAFRRARSNLKEKRAAEADAAWQQAMEPQFGTHSRIYDNTGRREPVLIDERRMTTPADEDYDYADEPVLEDEEEEELEEDDEGDEEEADEEEEAAPRRKARVSAPARRPARGKRAAREAQPSLLDDPEGFELPELKLLAEPKHKGLADEHRPERLEAQARRLEGVLEDFGVKGDIINVRPGPVVTLYELEPAPGIKSSRVISLADDIARSMSAISARVAVVPGRNAIGIELPNEHREVVYLREMLASQDFEKMKGKLPICLGKTIGGEPIIADLARMPHLLIAGTTGSGKSVGINTFILSLLYQMTPEQCRLIMIDPKMLELSIYDGIPHLLTPVVTDPSKAVVALKWAVREMEDRYRKMSKIGVRNIDGFNQRVGEANRKGETITRTVQTGFDRETGEAVYESEEFNLEPLPFIVVIIDEMADLMMVAGKDIEGSVQRLAQMARAAGIHVITATQRPSVDVITGTIKANFPTRISFQVTSKIDSRTILGEQGAEQLLGNGDMLYMAGGGRIRRLHGPFVSDHEVEMVVAHLKSQGAPDYLDSITADEEEAGEEGMVEEEGYASSGDELYDKAVHIVLTDKKASTSYIQRRLAIGYNKAATLIERMEEEGVISAPNHSGKREILVGNNADGY